MLSDVERGAGRKVSECSGRPIFIFLIKENWVCVITRHHAESNFNILLTRNLPFDSGVRQWRYLLMMLLHCLSAKSNNKTCGQFEYNVTWFYFCFDFVRSHVWCSCCSIVCWRGCEGSFKIRRPRSRGRNILDKDGQVCKYC